MAASRTLNQVTDWFVAAASVAGTKHVRRNSPNQDALCYRTLPGSDQLVVVICDGASSAAEGRAGAHTVADAALEWAWSNMEQKPDQNLTNLLRWTVGAARDTIIETAKTSGIPLREYAATLTMFAQIDGRAAAAQIGDGACVVGTDEGWTLMSEPQRGQHANETSFITQEDAIYRMCVSDEIFGVQRVMICTDGMMSLTLKQPGNVPYAPYFDGTFSWLESHSSQEKAFNQMQRLLLSERVRRLTDDDLTMFQATLLHLTPEAEDHQQSDRSDDGKEPKDATASKA